MESKQKGGEEKDEKEVDQKVPKEIRRLITLYLKTFRSQSKKKAFGRQRITESTRAGEGISDIDINLYL